MTYAEPAEIPFGYPVSASVAANTAFATVSGRRVCDLYGGRVARAFTPRRRVCAHFLCDLTSGTISGSTTLFSFGLNPANVFTAAYTTNSNERFEVRAFGSSLQIYRRAFNADGSVASGTQTIANVAHNMVAGSSYIVEIMVDVTSETGTVEVIINGTIRVSESFTRTIGTIPCNADFGIMSLHNGSSSGCRGRFSNVILYADDAETPWPQGQLNITYLPATANAGETISWPPLPADPAITVDSTTGKTWQLGDTVLEESAIRGVIGSVRLAAPNAVTPANADVRWMNGVAVLRTDTFEIQPGTPTFDRHITLPFKDPLVLNAMSLNVRKSS